MCVAADRSDKASVTRKHQRFVSDSADFFTLSGHTLQRYVRGGFFVIKRQVYELLVSGGEAAPRPNGGTTSRLSWPQLQGCRKKAAPETGTKNVSNRIRRLEINGCLIKRA